MVGTTHDELSCCLKCLPKEYTVIHPETKFTANAERNGNRRAKHKLYTIMKQISIIGRMVATPYFVAKQ